MNTKNLLFVLAMILSFSFASNVMALIPDHGSMVGTGLTVYNTGTNAVDNAYSINYKFVTIGSKPYVWVKNTGTQNLSNTNYGIQLRFWTTPTNYAPTPSAGTGKQEYCFAGAANRIPSTGDFKESIGGGAAGWSQGGTGWTTQSYITIYFFQNRETNSIAYNKTAKNSTVVGDVTAPAKPTYTMGTIAETAAAFTLASSDANDFFYYIKDEAHGIEQVSFLSNVSLSGLNPNTTYNLKVTAVDFSGNESAEETVTFTTSGFYNITSGETPDIRFVFKSTTSVLEYYYEYKDPTKTFREASLKITPAGGTQFEVKPTVSPDGKYCYGTTNNATINNKILNMTLGYFQFKEPINWDEYVVNIVNCTVGGNTKPIMHKMADVIAPAELEAVAPVLTSATLVEVTDAYIHINLQGSDNSGVVYYEIAGAEGGTINAFRTGDYYLTNILPGKVYTLTITAKDLSGNASAPQTLVTVNDDAVKLSAPTGLQLSADKKTLTFNPVANAKTHQLEVYDGVNLIYKQDNFQSGDALKYILVGNYTIHLKALGNFIDYTDSDVAEIAWNVTASNVNLTTDAQYCNYQFNPAAGQNCIAGDQDAVYLTWQTDVDGNIIISIAPHFLVNGTDNQTEFRGNGINTPANITVNGDPNTANKYFTVSLIKEDNLNKKIKLTKTVGATIPVGSQIAYTTGYIVYKTVVDAATNTALALGGALHDLYPNTPYVAINPYIYGSTCSGIGTSVYSPKAQSIAIKQSGNVINVISENAIAKISAYSVNGQLINTSNTNSITLNSGFYILNVKDINGNTSQLKVIIK